MSVINQMLNGLEQRGVQVATEELRPVREMRDTRNARIVLVMVLLVIFAVLVWREFPMEIFTTPKKAEITKKAPLIIVAGAVATDTDSVAASDDIAGSEMLSHAATELGIAAEVKSATGAVAGKDLVMLPQLVAASSVPSSRTAPPVKPRPEKSTTPKSSGQMPVMAMQNTLPLVQPIKQISVAQQADAEFRTAVALMKQGRNSEAQSAFEAALRLDTGHDAARQSLVSLLLDGKKWLEAELVLQDGLKNKPTNGGFAMLLARLQVQRNDLDLAVVTLENSLPYALQQAEYQAFYAALLQRKSRHQDAVEHYQVALKSAPNMATWLMGYGISLQALSRATEAKEAYQRALDAKTLSPELQAFVQQKINKP